MVFASRNTDMIFYNLDVPVRLLAILDSKEQRLVAGLLSVMILKTL